ncbi:putative glutamate-1-semialdehyde -aminomutase [Rosellinia necatrix]|uniref:Putative glutamate-1-semialdehyde-aminomutase n=1 Tax=Rosellinia necatrix TaxID=77044 RepID=A0A1S8A877_ROSNE|nr:putative glutamate-1-semialdehyde -aminomutase [Rosellinia necatrix]
MAATPSSSPSPPPDPLASAASTDAVSLYVATRKSCGAFSARRTSNFFPSSPFSSPSSFPPPPSPQTARHPNGNASTPPWYAPSKTRTLPRGRRVNALAAARASRLASVPELVKRRRSALGKRARTRAASRASPACVPPYESPFRAVRSSAASSVGCECPYRPAEYSPSRSTYACPSASRSVYPAADAMLSGYGAQCSTDRVLPPGRWAVAASCAA